METPTTTSAPVPGLEELEVVDVMTDADFEIVDTAQALDPECEELFALTGIAVMLDGTVRDESAKSAGAYDAAASWWLRRAREADLEQTRLKAAMMLELTFITQRYERQLGRATRDYTRAVEAVEQIAKVARDAGILEKKQSRDVGNGRFGWKAVAARVEIDDLDKAIAWAKEHVPQIVTTKTEVVEKLPVAALKPFIFGLVGANQPVPEGIVHHPASVKYFAETAE